VADWVLWALGRTLGSLAGRRVLVVGVGAVGSEVALRLQAAGVEVGLCDPPRAEREPGFASLELEPALGRRWDAVSLHVPLVQTGTHPTVDLLDRLRLAKLRGAVVLNAARGGVLDELAAVELRTIGVLAGLALDTFVGEPTPRPAVVAACELATPHIAGHSIEGKLRVAHRAVGGLRAHFGLSPLPPLADAVARVVTGCDRGTMAPATALDAADRALRSCTAQGLSFDVCRSAHRRVETAAGA
jgi:erythronate-4-phosphate dehydrogenase